MLLRTSRLSNVRSLTWVSGAERALQIWLKRTDGAAKDSKSAMQWALSILIDRVKELPHYQMQMHAMRVIDITLQRMVSFLSSF